MLALIAFQVFDDICKCRHFHSVFTMSEGDFFPRDEADVVPFRVESELPAIAPLHVVAGQKKEAAFGVGLEMFEDNMWGTLSLITSCERIWRSSLQQTTQISLGILMHGFAGVDFRHA